MHGLGSIDEEEENEFAMLVRKVRKLFYKKERMSNFRRSEIQEKDDWRKEDIGSCYNCKKSGHLIADCPSLKATSSKQQQKKKALKASWGDSESESDEEVDTANVCFMAHGDDPTKISLETTLDHDELTMEEIATFFEELQLKYEL